MEDIGLKLTPMVVRHGLEPLSMCVAIAGTSWTHSQSKHSYG